MRGGNWPWRLHTSALAHGYDWRAPQIAVALKGSVNRYGLDAVERAWNWWVKNAARSERPSSINPNTFARMAGYWLYMAKPIEW